MTTKSPAPIGNDAVPTNSLDVPRFVGIPTFMRLPLAASAAGLGLAVFGLPSDNGSPFRTGARFGPNAIRSMSVMLRPYNPYRNLQVFERLKCADIGDAPVVPGYMPATLERMEAFISSVVMSGAVPLALGGDHGCSISALRAVAKRHGPVGLLHFDAHSDTWDRYFGGERHSAGTPFRRAVEEGLVDPSRSIQLGLRGSLFTPSDVEQSRDLGYEVVTWDDWMDEGLTRVLARVKPRVGNGPVYLSFDMDFVDPAFAPGVQTPEAGGASASEALRFLRSLPPTHIVGADVVETNPLFDGPGQITALLAATVAGEIMAVIAASSKRSTEE